MRDPGTCNPKRPVPIYLAGSGPAATRDAGRAGDRYITTSGKAPELYTGTVLPAVREGAEKAGRAVADLAYLDLGFNHLVFHAPGPDQEKFLRLYGAEILPRLRAMGR